MANLTATRTSLATALKATGRAVYNHPAQTTSMPAIIIVPSNPYVEPLTIGYGTVSVAFDVTLAVAATDNAANLAAIETMIFDVLQKIPAGYNADTFTAPVPTEINGAPCVSTIVRLTTQITN